MPETFPYVTLVRVSGNNTKTLSMSLKNLPNKSNNCTVLGAWTTFGEYDGLVQFVAPSNEDAMKFVTDNVRSIQGVTSTETLPLVTQQSAIDQIPE